MRLLGCNVWLGGVFMSTSTKVLGESLLVWEGLGCFEDLIRKNMPIKSVVSVVINFILEIERIPSAGHGWDLKNLQANKQLQKPPCPGQVPDEGWWKWNRAWVQQGLEGALVLLAAVLSPAGELSFPLAFLSPEWSITRPHQSGLCDS